MRRRRDGRGGSELPASSARRQGARVARCGQSCDGCLSSPVLFAGAASAPMLFATGQ
ncbi:hypothetical protein [Lysobacter gummosus]|uniref:hypothetical protein n=1 Tax=Lysobacter gummosus TaxID=262324 RepID=UPI0036283B7C